MYAISAVDADTAWAAGYMMFYTKAMHPTTWTYKGYILKTTDGGSEWVPQVLMYEKSLYGIDAIDASTAWAVGAGGAILKTTDGNTWTPQNSGVTVNLNAVCAVDASTAWAVGTGGAILKTTDGNTWISQTSGTTATLRAVCAVDASTAWVVGDDGTILKTTDGGTWVPQASGVVTAIRGIDAYDGNVAWAAGEKGVILKTKDGGASWAPQDSGTTGWLYGVDAVDGSMVWVCGSDAVLGTEDGGDVWDEKYVFPTLPSVIGPYINGMVSAVDDSIAWVVLLDIVRTADGGESWVPQGFINMYMFSDISAADSSTCWGIGSYFYSTSTQPTEASIYKTTDGGRHWKVQETGIAAPFNGVSAVNDTTAWAVGGDRAAHNGVVLRTTDGATWEKVYESNTQAFMGVLALDEDSAWVWGKEGEDPSTGFIARTDSGGDDWTVQYATPAGGMVNDISAIDSSTAQAVGTGGLILKTEDGNTWVPQTSGTSMDLRGVSAVDLDTVWVAGGTEPSYTGAILKTADGGGNWTTVCTDSLYIFTDIGAVDEFTAWTTCARAGAMVPFAGGILKTVDGGATWAAQPTVISYSEGPFLFRVQALSAAVAWTVGMSYNGGVVFKTEDGGDARPDIVSLSPTSGLAGDEVTITGCDFGAGPPDAANYVSFGGVKAQAADYVSWADGKIVVKVPEGTYGEVAVTVTTPQGTSNPKEFQAPEPPFSLTSISPTAAGQFAIFQGVAVEGTGFMPGATLRLEKGTTSVLYAYNLEVTETRITGVVTLFGAEPGAYDVVVENPDGGQARLEGGFTVTSACGAGSGGALLLLGLTLGLLSLAGSARRRKKRLGRK
jgi:photosystem II stability/assembly factor-like uncharacterized protein